MKHIFLLLFVCFSFLNCSKSGDGSAIPSAIDLPSDNTPAEIPNPEDPSQPSAPAITSSIPPLNGSVQLIITPNPKGHVEFLQSINKTIAGDIIRMAMFHLTDNDVIDALGAAHKRGVTVKVILDGASLYLPNFKFGYDRLKSYGVDVRTGSTAFSISHQKSMVVNQTEAFITAINLTKLPETTRDFGLIVHDANVINEVISVFEQDWLNTETNLGLTPQLSETHLVWSPVNSLTKLVNLISTAKKSIIIQVENLGDDQIQKALIAVVKKGVSVRIIVPMCSKNFNPKLNYTPLKELTAAGIKAKVMPEPETALQPYMHSKMMIIDGVSAYVGSVNFSKNSTTQARELGILFSESIPIKKISEIFEQDWASAITVPNEDSVSCSHF